MMSNSDEQLGKEFHRTRQDDHQAKTGELAFGYSDGSTPSSGETLMDRADRAYAILHASGKIDEPFEIPSARSIRLQREAIAENRPPTFASFHWRHYDHNYPADKRKLADNPKAILADMPDGTVAIRESVNDNDAIDGSTTISWLECKDLEDARRYVIQVGEEFAEPGPGEDDGRYYRREIFQKTGPEQIDRMPVYER